MRAARSADLSGPVEGQPALEIRLLEVTVPLLRTRSADFEFRPDVDPPWPAPLAVPVATVFEPAQRIAREWSSIMTAIESFESVLERTGEITTDSVTLTRLGFRVLEQVDGQASIRELARRAGASLVAVAPEVRALVLAGAVRVVVGAERALATARADAERDRRPLEAALDVTVAPDLGAPDFVSPAAVTAMPTAAVEVEIERMTPADDPDDLARERACSRRKAGLSTPGPGPGARRRRRPGGGRARACGRSSWIGVNCSECSLD